MKTIILVWIFIFSCSVIYSQKKIALLIGNSNYEFQASLKNPVNDANLLKTKLQACGFEVQMHTDINRKKFINSLIEFREKLEREPCIALFYFSGHGIQSGGENYMLPLRVEISSEADVESEGISLNRIMSSMNLSKSIINIVILDACRNNPFLSTKGLSKGLTVPANPPDETFIAFATAPGNIAMDGVDNNSPYTKALATHMTQPGLTIEQVFKNVNTEVKGSVPGQIPWVHSSLGSGEFYFTNTRQVPVNNSNEFSMTDLISGIKTNMVYVEGGKYYMGAVNGNHDETPLHEVNIESFNISKYEITQDQWNKIMKDNPSISNTGCRSCPVNNVSWEEVTAFISRLNEVSGLRYRLPSEAEWEYASKGGKNYKDFRFSGGNRVNTYAWYYRNSDQKVQPVGKLAQNALGIFDMSGNIAEWCMDWYHPNYYKNSSRNNPGGPDAGKKRIVRGGSWNDYDLNVRVSARQKLAPSAKSKEVGFRLVY